MYCHNEVQGLGKQKTLTELQGTPNTTDQDHFETCQESFDAWKLAKKEFGDILHSTTVYSCSCNTFDKQLLH